MSHASKEISPGNIPEIHHKLFDPLDTYLEIQGIELKVEFVKLTKDVLYSYYRKLYRLKEIIEVSRKQADDSLSHVNFDEESFVFLNDDSRNKKNTLKYLKSEESYGFKKIIEYNSEHNLRSLPESFEDWRLSYLNYVANEPAEASGIYFIPSVNAKTLSELRTNEPHKKPTNKNLQINLLSEVNPNGLGSFISSLYDSPQKNNFLNERHRLRKELKAKRTGKTNENNFYNEGNT